MSKKIKKDSFFLSIDLFIFGFKDAKKAINLLNIKVLRNMPSKNDRNFKRLLRMFDQPKGTVNELPLLGYLKVNIYSSQNNMPDMDRIFRSIYNFSNETSEKHIQLRLAS